MGFSGGPLREKYRHALNISIFNRNHNLISGLVLLGIFFERTSHKHILLSWLRMGVTNRCETHDDPDVT